MNKVTKKILGCFGLLVVGTMTFIAYNMPSSVNAVNSAEDTITVTVLEKDSLIFNSPSNDQLFKSTDINVKTTFNRGTKIVYYLSYYNNDQKSWTAEQQIREHLIPDGDINTSGTDEFIFSLKTFLGENPSVGYYKIRAELYNGDVKSAAEPTVRFLYNPNDTPDIPVPNTGLFTSSPLSNLNIASIDFLITGFIVFFTVAGLSTYLVLRRK